MSHELKRALDVLSEKEKDLKRHTYKGIRELSLFRPEVSVVYYDLTTLYFESEISEKFYFETVKVGSIRVSPLWLKAGRTFSPQARRPISGCREAKGFLDTSLSLSPGVTLLFRP